jgi:hypothetical protein
VDLRLLSVCRTLAVNIVFLLGALLLMPMLIPLPFKNRHLPARHLPDITLILLTGGNFDITASI